MKKKTILVVYHSKGGTMKKMADRFVYGAAKEENIRVICKKAGDGDIDDLLHCSDVVSALLNISALRLLL